MWVTSALSLITLSHFHVSIYITDDNKFLSTLICYTFPIPQGLIKQTQNICITFEQRRPNVFDVGPALYKCYTNVLCLLGNTLSACELHSKL